MFIELHGNQMMGQIIAGFTGLAMVGGVAAMMKADPGFPAGPAADLVSLPGGSVIYRLPGEYLADGRPVDAPLETGTVRPLRVMRYQVTNGQYARCVEAGVCDKAATRGGDGVPVTGVSFDDAQAYAKWLTRRTGYRWRLPSDREWAYLAGERYKDDAIGYSSGSSDPSAAWLARYRSLSAEARPADPAPKPPGHYGANRFGIQDLGGNVWEWTTTCYLRVRVDATGGEIGSTENCGVLVAEGRHRSYMTAFVRDPKTGGCAVGTPPDNLGFRLVRERLIPFTGDWVAYWAGRLFSRANGV
ncbi:MAG: formylglycine-generating enzyme family protein [Flavobacteriaceae bacterium]